MSSVYTGVRSIASTSTLTAGTTATITTTAAHTLNVGDEIHIVGTGDPQLWGKQTVASIVSGTVFTVVNAYFTTATGSAGGQLTVDRALNITIPSDGDGPGIKAADVNVAFEAIVDQVDDIADRMVGYVLRGVYYTGKADPYSTTSSWAGATLTANTWTALTQSLTNADGDPNHLLTTGAHALAFDPLAQVGDIFVATFTCAVNLAGASGAVGLAVSLGGTLAAAPLVGSEHRIVPVTALAIDTPTPVSITGTYVAVAQGLVGFGLLVNGIFTTTPAIIFPNSWQITVLHYRPV